ncbi:MAG: O-antigen ligase family protein [Oligoflexia bacterium]|nr:O-antigen ligase family protein [Oligoflexia bacterium]
MNFINFILISLVFWGVIIFSRAFVKYEIFGIYILEVVAIVWLLINFKQIKFLKIKEYFIKNKYLVFYFLYGSFLLLLDFFSPEFKATPFNRVAQHSIIFVFPVIWTFIGFMTQKINPMYSTLVLLCVVVTYIINHLINILGYALPGSFLGLILIVPILYFLSLSGKKHWLYATGISLILFTPFWKMWGESFSRTGLVQVAFCTTILPFLFFKKSIKRTIFIVCFLNFVFLAGFAAVALSNHMDGQDFITNTKNDFYKAALHGDDVYPGEQKFNARFRTFVWKQTVLDWLERPLLGVGFIPETPSYLEPNFKNVGGYFNEIGAPPVNGAHNSFLTILARMGPIGLVLLLIYLFKWWVHSRGISNAIMNKYLILIPILSLISSLFNLGIESPHNSVIMWFCMGLLMAL